MTAARALAASIIDAVSDGQSLTECLETFLPRLKTAKDKAFVQAICYGVCRFYFRLDVLLSYLLEKPMKAKDSDLHALLLVGLYQLMAMRVPDYAAVTETVNATDDLNKAWGRGLVNAVLRRYLRDKEKLETQLDEEVESQYSHPLWWITSMQQAWPDDWEKILIANNSHPPFSLRVNARKKSRDEYLKTLSSLNEVIDIIPELPSGLTISPALPVEELPGFMQGQVSVQDGAAQLAATWLALAPGMRVLDACGAPGGKLAHILEIEPALDKVIVVEKDLKRIESIKENLTRLELNADIHCADAADVNTWWDGKPFDRILLDAPCSASGVVRRHPDIKLLREQRDIAKLAKEQLHLLSSLWPLLSENGILLYVTCSVFPQENEQVLKAFLAAHSDAQEDKIITSIGFSREIGLQILPGELNMDGFYYARLKKIPSLNS